MGGYIVVFIFVVIIITICGILAFIYARKRKAEELSLRQEEWRVRQENAFWGKATVVGSRADVSDRSTQAFIELTLEVMSQDKAPYRCSTTWFVDISAIGLISPGSEVSVKIDCQDPYIVYPNCSWARYINT